MCNYVHLYDRYSCGHSIYARQYWFECGQIICRLSPFHLNPCPTNCQGCMWGISDTQHFDQAVHAEPCPACKEAYGRGENPPRGPGRQLPRANLPTGYLKPRDPNFVGRY